MSSIFDKPSINDKPLWDVILGASAYPAVFVSYELNIFEYLNENDLTIKQVSDLLDVNVRPIEALVSTNISLGFIKKDGDLLSLTPLAKQYLIKDSSTSFCPLLDIVINNEFIGSSKHLKQAVLTNKAQTYAGDKDVFKSHEESAKEAKAFTKAMHSISMSTAMHWVNSIDLSNNKVFLDIGGGSGAHALCALNKWPNLKAILFDISSVCDAANEIISEINSDNDIKMHIGDMWDSNFPEADIHFYSQIFHDWTPEKCQFLAKKSFESLPKDGRIILHEMLYNDDKSGPFYAAASSVSMLLWTEGKQYSGLELIKILEGVGFQNTAVHKTSGLWQLVEGKKL